MAPKIDFTKFYNIIEGTTRDSSDQVYGINPATRGKLWPVPVATDTDIEDAVTSANKAFTTWSTTSVGQRKDLLASFKRTYSE